MTYHYMHRGCKEQGTDALESSLNNKQTNYMVILSFTKLDMIIESKTGDKFNEVKLHNNVTYFLPLKTCVILGEEEQYIFSEYTSGIDRRWLDMKLTNT